MMENAMTKGHHIGPFLVSPHKRNGKQTGGWLVSIPQSFSGKRRRKFFANRSLADQFAKTLDQKYRRGELSQQRISDNDRMTFRHCVEKWKAFDKLRVGTRKKKAISHQTDGYRLRIILGLLGDEDLSKIDEEKLTHYQLKRLSAGRTPATVNSDLKTIKQILRWAKKQKFIDEVPEVEKVPEEHRDIVVPTMDEVLRLISYLPERLQPVVRFMAATGCRSGEAFNLTWDCVDAESSTVEFKPKNGWTPKTQSSVRRVPISRKLMTMLWELPKDGDYVFRGKVPGKPIDNIKKAFATAVEKAEIIREGKPVRVTPHTLRKAYATWQATENHIDPATLKRMLGHSPASTVTDRFYVKPQEAALRRAVLDLPDLDNEGDNAT